jgi:mRNA-degrading endonuclease RelE of RelBE toxin-antitoxin system
MKVLVSRHAQERLESLSSRDREAATTVLELMQAEHFPRIRAMLRSDYATDDGMLVREFQGLRVVYKFLEDSKEPTVVIATVFRKQST